MLWLTPIDVLTPPHHDNSTGDFCQRNSPVPGYSLKGLATALVRLPQRMPSMPTEPLPKDVGRTVRQRFRLHCVLLELGDEPQPWHRLTVAEPITAIQLLHFYTLQGESVLAELARQI